ncbi:MAG: hypothetical protein J6W95_06925, partial [Bacteroidales bacterium]|nr:hypothetical protein [Bacteroidales bacterium]
MTSNTIDIIKRLAHEQREEVIAWRRWMHQHPELSQEEYKTMEFIAERLRGLGLEPRTGIGGTGVMAMIHGNAHGDKPYCVALRADFDALPITDYFNADTREIVHLSTLEVYRAKNWPDNIVCIAGERGKGAFNLTTGKTVIP